MRGLPGSGKSTLVKAVKDFFSDLEPAVCSADDFFIGEHDGVYRFNQGMLKDAHAHSQSAMKSACDQGKRLIIVDNTHVQVWEMHQYFSNANRAPYAYRVVIMEPKTPWCFDPAQLALKNTHGVDREVLEKKVAQFETALPIYYAWFLSPSDSRALMDRGRILFKNVYENCDAFRENFAKFSSMLNFQSAMDFYNRDMFVSGDQYILHCTAKFCGMDAKANEENGAKEFATNKKVQANLGKVQNLKIIGFFFTKETFGCRVELTDEQLEIYDQDEQIKRPQKRQYGTVSSKAKHPNKDEFKEPITIEEIAQKLDDESKRFNPVPGLGRRAHITLATAPGVKAVNTGIDLLEIVKAERECEAPTTEVKLQDDTKDVLRQYKDNLWVFYPEYAISVQSIFTGYYDRTYSQKRQFKKTK